MTFNEAQLCSFFFVMLCRERIWIVHNRESGFASALRWSAKRELIILSPTIIFVLVMVSWRKIGRVVVEESIVLHNSRTDWTWHTGRYMAFEGRSHTVSVEGFAEALLDTANAGLAGAFAERSCRKLDHWRID